MVGFKKDLTFVKKILLGYRPFSIILPLFRFILVAVKTFSDSKLLNNLILLKDIV